jgi:hypothetical protein
VLLVTATGRDVDRYEFVPATLVDGVATPVAGDEAAAATAQWDAQRGCTGLAP